MALEIRELTTIGDYFVNASGGSDTQVKALSDAVGRVFPRSARNRGASGYQSGMWIVLDYYDVIVHIFTGRRVNFTGLNAFGPTPRGGTGAS